MLALVTCHIFPPQSDTEKNEFLAPDFPADSSQFFRVHGFTSAVRQMPTAMRNPFAWTNVSSGKNACFAIWPHVGTKFFNLSHHFLSMDGWPGDAIFFLWGQPLKIIHKNSAKKRSSPLDFIFDTCASASSSHLFLVGEAEHMWLYPFARTTVFSATKHVFCNLGARWHKILEFVPSCPISGWLAWWCDFFPVFYVDACLKGKLNSHQRCTTNSGDDILGALGCQWHFSGQFEQSFVCSNWCLQKVLIFQTKNMGIPCLGMVSRACLGVSPGVSACLGHVSAYLGVSRRVWGWCLGVFGVSRDGVVGKKKHDLIISYQTQQNGLPLREQ